MATRQYNRKCGFCRHKADQSKMVRTNNSPNGWVCRKCRNDYKQEKKKSKEFLNPVDVIEEDWIAEQAYCFDF